MKTEGKFRGFLRRLLALCHKETLQIFRDPSSNLIAFVLPVVMLFIFGYGINLDSTALRVGLVLQDTSPEARRFADTLRGSPYLAGQDHRQSRGKWRDGWLGGQVQGFGRGAARFRGKAEASGRHGAAAGHHGWRGTQHGQFRGELCPRAWDGWQMKRAVERGEPIASGVTLEPRYWFNPSAESRNYLVPGSITIIMTVIGALLTSLVVAREWERGTMEALLASPVTRTELLLSKLIPYYALGIDFPGDLRAGFDRASRGAVSRFVDRAVAGGVSFWAARLAWACCFPRSPATSSTPPWRR